MTAPVNEVREDVKAEGLRPCPFCATSEAFVERADFSGCFVVCNQCSARGPVSCDENDDDAAASASGDVEPGELPARRLWNTRPPQEAGEPVAWRGETTSEHLARDMREGRFPEQSERQQVPVTPNQLLGEFCACYAEAWPSATCDAETKRLAQWLGTGPTAEAIAKVCDLAREAIDAKGRSATYMQADFYAEAATIQRVRRWGAVS